LRSHDSLEIAGRPESRGYSAAARRALAAHGRLLRAASPEQVAHRADGVEADDAPEPLVATNLRIAAAMKVTLSDCHQPERDTDEDHGERPLSRRTRPLDHPRLTVTDPIP
jgi:hypothetical protein